MTYEYSCDSCSAHFSVFFRSFAAAEPFVNSTECEHCNSVARRVFSTVMPAHLYGDPAGYSSPSPTKRHSYKLIEKSGNN